MRRGRTPLIGLRREWRESVEKGVSGILFDIRVSLGQSTYRLERASPLRPSDLARVHAMGEKMSGLLFRGQGEDLPREGSLSRLATPNRRPLQGGLVLV